MRAPLLLLLPPALCLAPQRLDDGARKTAAMHRSWWHYPYELCHAPPTGFISQPAGLPPLSECPSTEGQAGLYPLSQTCVAKFKAACEIALRSKQILHWPI